VKQTEIEVCFSLFCLLYSLNKYWPAMHYCSSSAGFWWKKKNFNIECHWIKSHIKRNLPMWDLIGVSD